MKNLKCTVLMLVIGAGVFIGGKSFAQVPSYLPTNGLVGWWPFNGNANDESGNGNNGTVNGALLTNDRFNYNNSAFEFNSNEFIFIPNSNSLNSNYISISIWFQTNSQTFGSLIYKTNPSAINEQYGLIINYPSLNNSIWSVKNGNNCNNPGIGWQTTTLSQNLADNIWHNIVCTYDGAISKIYLDNNFITSNIFAPDFIDACGGEINIGKGYNLNYFFSGKIDDIGIWNRELSQQEITDIYYGCSSSIISTQPVNQTVNTTNSAQFIVNANTGSSFQWQTDLGLGFQNLSNAGQYSGVNNDTLIIANTSITNNNQQFRCIVNSGSCTDTSDIAILTISTSGINELAINESINLYPNPASSIFEIQTKLIFDKIEIRDMQGRIVKTEHKVNKINIESIQKGTYVVQLIDDKSKVIGVKRLIKE